MVIADVDACTPQEDYLIFCCDRYERSDMIMGDVVLAAILYGHYQGLIKYRQEYDNYLNNSNRDIDLRRPVFDRLVAEQRAAFI